MLMYRAHDRILRKAVDLNHGGPAVFRLGISGPNYLDADSRPNWQTDEFTLSPRDKLSDFIAGEWSNDGGCPTDSVRNLIGYARQVVVPAVARGNFGSGMATPWYQFTDRVGWAPHGDWKPDDWDSTHPQEDEFHPPWPYLDCSPLEKLHGYPWCEPAVFYGWWANYINCVNPPCTQHGPQNPWGVNCPECAQLGLKRLGGFPAGVVYLTIEFDGQAEEIFGASLIHGPAYLRAGGGLTARYMCRLGPPRCSGDFAYWLAKLLAEAGTSPWSSTRYVAIATAADQIRMADTIPLADLAVAFPEMFSCSWTITPYAPPVWNPPHAPPLPPDVPEVLPCANLTIAQLWTNQTEADITVRSIGIVGFNGDRGHWELLFWGPLDGDFVVTPGSHWQPDAVQFRFVDMEGH